MFADLRFVKTRVKEKMGRSTHLTQGHNLHSIQKQDKVLSKLDYLEAFRKSTEGPGSNVTCLKPSVIVA